tara:strand:- start:7067 stop:7525 length:459 start_codon:yes stop_codon:yes gene_type:complete
MLFLKYNDIYAEIFSRHMKLKTEFKQCNNNWKNLSPSLFKSLLITIPQLEESKLYHIPNPILYLQKLIENLQKINQLLIIDYQKLTCISQVNYRVRHKLLHTLPKRRIDYCKSIYPNITNSMLISKKNYYKNIRRNIPVSSAKRVRFLLNRK